MRRLIEHLLRLLGQWRGRRPSGSAGDPYAWKPVPRKRPPAGRVSAVAVAEPDED
jgi:hypothetical protein